MISMKVHGMHCNGCVGKVKHALNALDQSARIQIDLKSGQVEIQSSHLAVEFVQIIKKLGYEVTDIKEA